jgi:hypothetical protein
MILELIILFEVILVGIFMTSFFVRQELLWAVSLVVSGLLMIASYNVQITQYVFDATTNAYATELVSYSFPFLMGFNMLFFALSLILGLFDFFDKYGINTGKFKVKK